MAKQITNKPYKKQAPKPITKAIKSNSSATNSTTAILWPMAVVLLTFIAFFPALKGEFTNWDDSGYVTENMMIRGMNLKEIFSSYVQGNYHPLTMLSYAFEYHFVQLKPWLYHFDNVLLHCLNALLVFVFIKKLCGKPEIAFITATLFGIHPMHVESVAWASERKDVLYVFFLLLALISYLRYVQNKEGKTLNFAATLLFFICSGLAKGQAVALAPLIVLVDFFLAREFNRKLLLEKVPIFLIAITFGIVAIMAQHSSDAIQSAKLFSFFERIMFASYGFMAYIAKLIIPVKLSAFYPYPIKSAVNGSFSALYYICPVIVASLLFIVLKFMRSNRFVLFGLGFFCVTIVFVIQLLGVGSTIMADRYSYLPYVGLFFLIGYGFHALIEKKATLKPTLIGALGIFGAVLIFTTRARCEVWASSVNLWTDVIEKYKNVPVAYNNRGLFYKGLGKYDLALIDYNNAEKVDPTYQATYENRANIYFLTNHFEESLKDVAHALKLKSNSEVAINTRGAVYFNQGKYDLALKDFDAAIKIKKDYFEAYRNRGNAYSVLGNFDAALADYNFYLKFDSKFNQMYYWRGIAHYNLKLYDNSINDLSTAIKMGLGTGDVYLYRSKCYFAKGDKASAQQDFAAAQSMHANIDAAYAQSMQ
jgi:tetratricopeptide (TPR) repeat protein